MSASDSKDIPGEVAEGSHESSNDPEPTNSIWTTPLRPGQIRLFNIELDDNDGIRGTLKVFEHKSAPQYIAQSYACGEGECDKVIAVNGYAHHIKPNLFTALCQTKRALQQSRSGRYCLFERIWPQTTWLWIDAISIHQSNVAELEMQIQFMEHIYRGASSTFVSLGNWNESHELISLFFEWLIHGRAVEMMMRRSDYNHLYEHRTVLLEYQASLVRMLQTKFNISAEDLRAILWHVMKRDQAKQPADTSSFFDPFWQACMKLTDSDWFSRVWTFQELVLSRKLFVTLQTSVPWEILRSLLQCVVEFPPNHPQHQNWNWTPAGLVRYGNFAEKHHTALRYHAGLPEPNRYLRLLAITAQRRATVPKDHVFAILGLLDAATQSLIEVDYSKTDAQVFREFLELALKIPDASQMLPKLWENFAQVPITTPGLPSWCLDLNNKTDARLGVWIFRATFSKAIECALTDAAHLRVSPEDGLIFLKVLELDVVSTQCADPCPDWPIGESSLSGAILLMAWIKCVYDDILSDSGDHLPALEVRLKDFFKIADQIREYAMALHFLVPASLLPAEGLTLCKIVSHVRQGLHATHELGEEILEYINNDPGHKTFARDLRMVAVGLKVHFDGAYVFATKGGRLGYSAKPVSPGDRICVVPGGELLHIFSAAPSRYVTCTVVQGLMEDSLLEVVRESDRDWEEITVH